MVDRRPLGQPGDAPFPLKKERTMGILGWIVVYDALAGRSSTRHSGRVGA
jgi:hypothetical protein